MWPSGCKNGDPALTEAWNLLIGPKRAELVSFGWQAKAIAVVFR